MNDHHTCIVFSSDPDIIRRLQGSIGSMARLDVVSDPGTLKRLLSRTHPVLLWLDAHEVNGRDLLPTILKEWPATLIIVIGEPGSLPMLNAETTGVYAQMDANSEIRAFQAITRQALKHLELATELRMIHSQNRQPAVMPTAVTPKTTASVVENTLRQHLPPLRHFDHVHSLLQGIIDAVANSAMVLRAAIFAYAPDQNIFQLHAGIGCRDDIRALRITPDDPLVRWCEINAQIICRTTLCHIPDHGDQIMLQNALETMGAELIIPLHGHKQMLGWLCFGRRASGEPFNPADFQEITLFAEHVATILENALLYKEVTLQKTFAETMLHTIPTGIIATDETGNIHWFNDAASTIFYKDRTQTPEKSREWVDPQNHRYLSLQTARLMKDQICIGAVAFIHDMTRERQLVQKQKELDRAAFWTEIAANMSHEIRNPLVAIKTFSQLLPERYTDPEFRQEFSQIVSHEVDRLNSIIQQINTFANLPAPVFEPVDIRDVIRKGIEQARTRIPLDGVDVRTHLDIPSPLIHGDKHALTEAVAHVVRNAIEALKGSPDPYIDITLTPAPLPESNGGVEITIRDNGPGMPPAIRQNAFSLFCTTKPSGMGLGLPIVQRTIYDHNGQVQIDSTARGTCISMVIPREPKHAEVIIETSANRG